MLSVRVDLERMCVTCLLRSVKSRNYRTALADVYLMSDQRFLEWGLIE